MTLITNIKSYFDIKEPRQHKWSTVDRLGKMRFSKSSYYWLVIVPLIVKITENLNSPLKFEIYGEVMSFPLELPFSWKLFFFGALLISIGSTLYQLYCPHLIKNYSNYGEFLASGQSNFYLDYVIAIYKIDRKPFDFIYDTPFTKKADMPEDDQPQSASYFERGLAPLNYKYDRNYEYDHKRQVGFNAIYEILDKKLPERIKASMFFFYLGFACFIWVLLQNIWFVIQTLP